MNPPHPEKRAGLIARQERQTMGAQLRDALADVLQQLTRNRDPLFLYLRDRDGSRSQAGAAAQK